MLSNESYEYRVFSSGEIFHTVEATCILNGKIKKHSFKGFSEALGWIIQEIDYHAFRKAVDRQSSEAGSLPK